MAFEIPGPAFPIEASTDLSSNQFNAVVVNGSGQLAVAGAGVAIDGVLQDDPDLQGRSGAVVDRGISKVVAGAAVAQGALVMSNGSGRAITATSGNFVIGRALEAAGSDGEVISVHLGLNHILP